MDNDDIETREERLAEAQKKFVSSLYLTFDVIEGLNERLAGFGDYLKGLQELAHQHSEVFAGISSAMEAMLKAFGESHVAINENTQRMDKLIAKVDSYFGSGEGLEHEN